MKSFLIGFGVGVGLALLFAPMSGEETRSNLADRANDLANSARETYEQNRDRVQRGVIDPHLFFPGDVEKMFDNEGGWNAAQIKALAAGKDGG